MTGISLHMQWPMTSQSHGSFLNENNVFLLQIKLHALKLVLSQKLFCCCFFLDLTSNLLAVVEGFFVLADDVADEAGHVRHDVLDAVPSENGPNSLLGKNPT
jgi:hypothetical protein